MAPEKSPAFQFYPKDFLTDGHVASMTLEERGAYITLLCLCWTESTLPIEERKLSRMLGCSLPQFRRVWPALQGCFHVATGPDRLIHPRLEKEREKQATYRQQQKDRAAKRWHQPGTATAMPAHMPDVSRTDALRSPISDLRSAISDLQNRDRARAPKPALVGDAGFQRFWAIYPNKKGKDDALKAWNKRRPSEALTDLIIAAVEKQMQWPTWTKEGGRFIPHPATWLNRGCWDDEPVGPVVSVVSDVGRQNAANAAVALKILEDRDAAQ